MECCRSMQVVGLVMWRGGLSYASCRWPWPAGLRRRPSEVAGWLLARVPVTAGVLVGVACRVIPTMQSRTGMSLPQEAVVVDSLVAVAYPVTAASCRRLILLAPHL